MQSMSEYSHRFVLPALHPGAVCIDATLGRGRDSQFFLDQNAARVIAYEIQQAPFEAACTRIQNRRFFPRLASHTHMKMDWPDLIGKVDAILFNFGYDPAAPDTLTTHMESSLEAIAQAIDLLRIKGRMGLVFYPHAQGQKEKEAAMAYLAGVPGIDVLEIRHPFKINAPSLVCVEKIHVEN